MDNYSNNSAENQLRQITGLENIKKQFERYRNDFKLHRDGKVPGKFHQHMAFMGNPGTGKTTVARLFAEILHEDGLLTKGQFVGVSPIDLISPYIGQTSSKTQGVCDTAKGGVLFIDEAYGLMNDFGQEAIEVLIQFMMNNDDTVVIFAGYSEKIKKFIDVSFIKTHFLSDLSIYYFEDYEPDVLYQIARKNIPEEIETTPVFDKALHNIIVLKHAYRTKKFGNARDMENLASIIVSTYEYAEVDGPLDIIHLPDKLRVLVDPAIHDENVMLAELNAKIVGQENIKSVVLDLFYNCIVERTKMAKIEGYQPKLQPLNFIFAGNPGTGKTTVARIIGNLLQKMGVLSSNDDAVLTEVSGGEVANMRPDQIQDLFEDNIGKVLFIDEAYMLAENPRALDEIVSNMTRSDYRGKLCLILAGYTAEMHQMMRLNLGMSRRFEEILFHDYTNEELWEILKHKINAPDSEFSMDEHACEEKALHYFASLERGSHFGNAGIVEILLSQLKLNLSKRYLEATNEQKADPDFTWRILPEDFPYTHVDTILPSPMKRLENMHGLDNIKKQFKRYLYAFKRYRDDGSSPFRPHMVFMGNPGTGKTTVARLFGEILNEEGLLSQGQFVDATVGDLVGQYIGETRSKTQAVCDRAKGGVLFIDEAYGLMPIGGGTVDFRQEAIEVLIQFMEDDDSLVVFAGYPEETKRLIAEGNPGLKRRFNEIGIFHFEDYAPDSLFNILVDKLNGYEMTEECKSEMRQIIRYQYEHRDEKSWGNARTIENYANEILGIFFSNHHGDGIIDVDCIPEHIRIPKTNKKQLKEELMLIVNEIQEKLQQLQSKLNELSEE